MGHSRLVYSSDSGRTSEPKPSRPARPGKPDPSIPSAPDDGWVRLWLVKGGRGGKTVTVVTGIPATEDVQALATALKHFAGTGGGVRQGAIELQGDHRERLRQHLTILGFRVKLAGG